MLDLSSGETFEEIFKEETESYEQKTGKVLNYLPPEAESLLALEVKEGKVSMRMGERQETIEVFEDKGIMRSNVFVCVEFKEAGDAIYSFDYHSYGGRFEILDSLTAIKLRVCLTGKVLDWDPFIQDSTEVFGKTSLEPTKAKSSMELERVKDPLLQQPEKSTKAVGKTTTWKALE